MSDETDVDTGDGTVEGILGGLIEAFTALEGRVVGLEQTEQTAELPFAQWLERITDVYGLDQSLRSWEAVPGLRSELEALHAAWLSAQNGDLEPKVGFQAVTWHDSLQRVIERADWWRARAKRRTATT